jgi:hypothetical protein
MSVFFFLQTSGQKIGQDRFRGTGYGQVDRSLQKMNHRIKIFILKVVCTENFMMFWQFRVTIAIVIYGTFNINFLYYFLILIIYCFNHALTKIFKSCPKDFLYRSLPNANIYLNNSIKYNLICISYSEYIECDFIIQCFYLTVIIFI